jgi:hypothetical protein
VSYLDPQAFQLPDPGTFGTMAKGSLRGPNYVNWDMAVSKAVRLHGDALRLQFRAEYFNVLNRVNLNDPGNSISGSTFGQIVGASSPRIGQLSLKLIF